MPNFYLLVITTILATKIPGNMGWGSIKFKSDQLGWVEVEKK